MNLNGSYKISMISTLAILAALLVHTNYSSAEVLEDIKINPDARLIYALQKIGSEDLKKK